MIPHDEIDAFAAGEVVRSVSVRSKVHHAPPLDVRVRETVSSVRVAAQDAAEGEARALEVSRGTR